MNLITDISDEEYMKKIRQEIIDFGKYKKYNKIMARQEFEKRVCDSLGLEHVKKLEIVLEVGALPVAIAKIILHQEKLKSFVEIIEEYKLILEKIDQNKKGE